MRYEGPLFRPPSEAYSTVVLISLLCFWGCEPPANTVEDPFSCSQDSDCASGYVCLPLQNTPGTRVCVDTEATSDATDEMSDSSAPPEDVPDDTQMPDGADFGAGLDASAGPGLPLR